MIKFLLKWVLNRPFLQVFVDLAQINKMFIEFLLIWIVQCRSQQKKEHFLVHFNLQGCQVCYCYLGYAKITMVGILCTMDLKKKY